MILRTDPVTGEIKEVTASPGKEATGKLVLSATPERASSLGEGKRHVVLVDPMPDLGKTGMQRWFTVDEIEDFAVNLLHLASQQRAKNIREGGK